ncbi:unnamed protein product [Rotaria sordida]|uniref:Lipase domain-containing protein n=1 Tax=Rotaria sordida TaxID=392033 RepID=A0A813S8E0_9BILA|nr:unnamed protein product [Rotaria sordida]CAF0833337.1 unnamed protein product [Rotaria sordida]
MVRPFLLFIYLVKIFILIQKLNGTTEYDTYFHVFSKQNIDKPISIIWTDTTKWLKVKSFQNCSIKLIAHGYAERWNMDWRWDWVNDMKNEFLNNKTKENICVIAIDWEKGAREINFITAVANADIAGEHLAEFIQNNYINPKRLHCIGFSLGAHLCGFASNNYYIITKKQTRFAHITGLDPSGPLLRKASIDKRLSLDDADFVDCIHTSSTFGLQEKSGHMDFFPDGGKSNAKGCEKFIVIKDKDEIETNIRIKRFLFNRKQKQESSTNDNDLPEKNFIGIIRDRIGRIRSLKKVFLNIHAYIGCNHLRSPHYYISSINQCNFRAKLCSTWLNYLSKTCNDPIDNDLTYPRMGFHADKSDSIYRRGNNSYYLKTTPKKPYCSPSSSSSTTEKNPKTRTSVRSKLKKKLTKLRP